jgi:hypothetical protein
MSVFTPSFLDRCFVMFLSILLMMPTGWGLKMYFTLDHSKDNPDWMLRLFLILCMEVVGTAFLLSAFGLMWAVCNPAWLQRTVRFVLDHFVLALAAVLFLVFSMLMVGLVALLRA